MTFFKQVAVSISTFIITLGLVGCGGSGSSSQEDPLFAEQWHLENTGQTAGAENAGTAGEDLNVVEVWESYKGSKAHAIAIVDNGVEAKHPDLKENLDLTLSYRYSDGSNDPTSNNIYDPHGTSVAGIIAAKGWNGIGTRGIAPNARIVGLNVMSDLTEANLIDAILRSNIAISSNSWGFSDNSLNEFESIVTAMNYGSQTGREGKGTVYVFAAGNNRGGRNNANANFASLTNNRYAIAVASVNADGNYASYSSFGSSILISGTGGEFGIKKPAVVTTDLTGLDQGWDMTNRHFDVPGNEEGDYTNRMTGTSAACPTVTGVSALMLEANPNLSWRDVRYLLATTARKNDTNDGNWTANAAGHPINYNYGFGVVDAQKAVNASKVFTGLGSEMTFELSDDTHSNVPKDAKTALIRTMALNKEIAIEHIDLWITINGENTVIGDLEIKLTSPQGTESILAWGGVRTYGTYDDWRFGTVRHLDESSLGTWKLSVKNVDGENTYELAQWKMKIYGHTP